MSDRAQLIQDLDLATRAGDMEMVRAIEAKLSQAPVGGTHQPAPKPPANIPRSIAASAALGSSSAMAGVLDFINKGATSPRQSQVQHPMLAPLALLSGREPAPLTPKVQELKDELAGGDSNNFLANVAGVATGSLLFPGSAGLNFGSGIASGTAGEMLQGSGFWPKLGGESAAGLMAAALLTKGKNTAQGLPGFLARGRLQNAVDQSAPDVLDEIGKLQELARVHKTFILPSQGTAKATPGLELLETEVLASKAGGVQPMREKVFGQVDDAARLSGQFIDEAPGRVLPQEEAAAGLVAAAKERNAALRGQGTTSAQQLYDAGNAVPTPIGPGELRDVRLGLQNTRASAPAGGFVQQEIDWLLGRLDRAQLERRELTARDLTTIHDEFRARLDAPRADGSIVPSADKETLRRLSEANVRAAAEAVSPQLREARELAGAFKAQNEYDPFDLVTREGRTTATKPALSSVVKNPRIATELADGVTTPVFGEAGERVGQVTQAANLEPARSGLKTGLDAERQNAFRRVDGKINPQAPASLINAIAPSPEAKGELAAALSRLGGDGERAGELLDVMEALSRPTVVRGVKVDTTGVSPLQAAQAGGLGGSLQVHQARAGIIRALVNRLSDTQVAAALSRPDFAEVMAKLPGARAMTPRAALAAVLSAQQGENEPTE